MAWAPRKRRLDPDLPLVAKAARGAKLADFGGGFQPVAGFDLDGRDAFRQQRIEARQGCSHQRFFVASRVAVTVDRMPPPPGDLLVAGAFQPHLELGGAVAGIDQMGVAVDQPRRDPAALAVDASAASWPLSIGVRADKGDPPATTTDRAVPDGAIGLPGGVHGRDPRIDPKAIQLQAPSPVDTVVFGEPLLYIQLTRLNSSCPELVGAPMEFFAENALLADGWARDVVFKVDGSGVISAMYGRCPAGCRAELGSVVVPGMANLHSHAFQRAMAGWPNSGATAPTVSGHGADHVRLLDRLTPDDVEAIAALVLSRCWRPASRRWGSSTTFTTTRRASPTPIPPKWLGASWRRGSHRHRPDAAAGLLRPWRLWRASAAPGQRRFINDIDSFARLMEGAGRHVELSRNQDRYRSPFASRRHSGGDRPDPAARKRRPSPHPRRRTDCRSR